MEGGSWTNNISWVTGYENLLTPMNQLSAEFHQVLAGKPVDSNSQAYRNALFHLLARDELLPLLGPGRVDRLRPGICRRGTEILAHDFR